MMAIPAAWMDFCFPASQTQAEPWLRLRMMMPCVHGDRFAIDTNPEFLAMRHFLAALRVLKNVGLCFCNLHVLVGPPIVFLSRPLLWQLVAAYNKHAKTHKHTLNS